MHRYQRMDKNRGWYEKSHNSSIKGYKDPQCNQTEVIHAVWIHGDCMGVSLLDVYMFDIRNALILENQLKQFQGGSYGGVSGLNQKQANVSETGKKQAAHQFGRDLLNFGLKGSILYCSMVLHQIITSQTHQQKIKISFDKMFEKRKANVKTQNW